MVCATLMCGRECHFPHHRHAEPHIFHSRLVRRCFCLDKMSRTNNARRHCHNATRINRYSKLHLQRTNAIWAHVTTHTHKCAEAPKYEWQIRNESHKPNGDQLSEDLKWRSMVCDFAMTHVNARFRLRHYCRRCPAHTQIAYENYKYGRYT